VCKVVIAFFFTKDDHQVQISTHHCTRCLHYNLHFRLFISFILVGQWNQKEKKIFVSNLKASLLRTRARLDLGRHTPPIRRQLFRGSPFTLIDVNIKFKEI